MGRFGVGEQRHGDFGHEETDNAINDWINKGRLTGRSSCKINIDEQLHNNITILT